jgi:chromosomal replication initiation ATPase DnaA
VCKFYNVSRDELYRSRRGRFNEPRNVAIFLNRKLRCDSLKEIGRLFQMEKYSSISSIIERMKKQMLADSTLKRRVDKVAEKVSKSQEQT